MTSGTDYRKLEEDLKHAEWELNNPRNDGYSKEFFLKEKLRLQALMNEKMLNE